MAGEWRRLGALVPGELGSLALVRNVDLFASLAAGTAVSLLCALLAAPLARSWGSPVFLAWAAVGTYGFGLAVLSVTATLAIRDPGYATVPHLIAVFVAVDTACGGIPLGAAWVAGGYLGALAARALRTDSWSAPT